MPKAWYRLDNAAKVFTATSGTRDPRVFRVSCTLAEPVDPGRLDEALRRTVREQPSFQVTLHRGLFWHYLEATDKLPTAVPETLPPCSAIYGPDQKNELLYRVSYYGCRINVEMYHALTDGNGGVLFLRALVRNYLRLCHPQELGDTPGMDGSSAEDRAQDSFRKYYTAAPKKAPPPARAFRLRGLRLPFGQQQFFEAHLSTKAALALARSMGVSLTSLLGACLMLAVYREMPALARERPVTVGLPVNLRNYFPSETARNFFNSVRVSHRFTGGETLPELAAEFDASLRAALSEENIRAQMDQFEKLEQMMGIRMVPLMIKNPVVAFFSWKQARSVTLTLSNMGSLRIIPAFAPYVRGFSAFCSAADVFTAVCSYGDDLVLGTSSVYRNTNVLKNFYRSLADAGLELTLYATEVEKE